MPSPLTESLVVHWPPSLRYHERRLDLLTDLDSKGELKQFRVRDDEVGARAEDAQLTLHERGITLHARDGLLQDRPTRLLRSAMELIAPPRFHFLLFFQFLVPIPDQSYDEARTTALSHLSGSLLPRLGAEDFGCVVDGTHDGVKWHCEFGIVSADEVGPRMRREVGTTANFGGPPPFFQPPKDTPDVAFFADLMWEAPTRPVEDESAATSLLRQIEELRVVTEDMISQVHAYVRQGSLEAVAGGAEP